MDASEGNDYWKGTKKSEFPPLYESVNDKEPENGTTLCPRINRALLPFKLFYFFFYGAIGSLFPFLALYFKHLWLTPTQAGFLVGLRPIVQSFSVPLWAMLADKFKLKKMVLLIGLCGWLFTHVSIILVPPGEKPLSCYANGTTNNAETKRSFDKMLGNAAVPSQGTELNDEDAVIKWQLKNSGSPHFHPFNGSIKLSNKQTVNRIFKRSKSLESSFTPDAAANIQAIKKEDGFIEKDFKRSFWSPINQPMETWHTFAWLCLIVIIGNLFASPAQTMANTAALQVLAADTHKYGLQRYFGSVGWGFTSLFVGMLVSLNHDRSLMCNGLDDINYTPCFYAFGILMLFAFIIALFFKFENNEKSCNVAEIGVCISVYQELNSPTCFVLLIALLAGFNMGFIQTFLFWYLQSIGGTQLLFSLMTGVNAVGEMIGFVVSVRLIDTFGHLKVLSLGLAAYAVRLFVYGLVRNPWAMLSVELLKAFTSSSIWASVLSFIGMGNASDSTLLSLLHMLYFGVGYGGAGIIGGVLTQHLGARVVFLALAFITLLGMFGVLLVLNLNWCPKRTQNIYMPVTSDEEDEEDNQQSEQ